MGLDVILLHPEYHRFLDEIGKNKEKDFTGESNPFLHMSLHLALEEQLSIDQPNGVASSFAALTAKHGERHAAMHDAMECLGEMVWRSQRDHAAPDAAAYLDCLKKRAGR